MTNMQSKSVTQIWNRSIQVQDGDDTLNGLLNVPMRAKGIVIFAHGSGSGRHSPRNNYVASVLNEYYFATVLADLLTAEEEVIDSRTRHLRFNITLLAKRLGSIVAWAEKDPLTRDLPICLFGASTGAAAALIVAANRSNIVKAVVSRGGRPDLAEDVLPHVKAPTLLIAGEHDPQVVLLNQKALETLNKESALSIVPRATHLFEESGTLEKAAELAAQWFDMHMG